MLAFRKCKLTVIWVTWTKPHQMFQEAVRVYQGRKNPRFAKQSFPNNPCMVYFPTFDFYGKCRWIYHAWILWDWQIGHLQFSLIQPSMFQGRQDTIVGTALIWRRWRRWVDWKKVRGVKSKEPLKKQTLMLQGRPHKWIHMESWGPYKWPKIIN